MSTSNLMDDADENEDDEKYIKLYHHTDQSSLEKIKESGCIKQSEDVVSDALFGKASYFTTLGPGTSRIEVAENNYDDAFLLPAKKIEEGKTEAAVECVLKKEDVKQCPAGDRDVYTYEGDLKFSDAKEVNFFRRNAEGELEKLPSNQSKAKEDSHADN